MAKRKRLVGFLFALPSIIGVLLFFGIPFAISIVYSFVSDTSSMRFVGFQNYVELFQSGTFVLALKNMTRFVLTSVPLLIVIALLIAIIFNNIKTRYFKILFTGTIISMAVPSVVIVLVVQILFERYGAVNGVLSSLKLAPEEWLNSGYAFLIIVGLYLWRNVPYSMIIFFTGLQQIEPAIYEAASMDGATPFQKFRYMTLPHLVPSLFFTIIMGISGVFKIFRESYLLLGNYPNEKVYMLQNFLNNNFMNINYKRLSSASLIFFVALSVLVILMMHYNAKSDIS